MIIIHKNHSAQWFDPSQHHENHRPGMEGPCLRFPSPRSFTSFCMVALSCTSMPLITCSGKNRIHIGWDKFIITYVRMCMCTHVCIHVSVDGWMYACIHGHVWWCMITYDDVSVWLCMINYDYMHVDMEVWMCGCMYHYVSMYTHYIILKIDYNPCIEYSPRRCSSCCMSHLRHPVGMSRVYSSYASRMTFKWRFPKIGVPQKIIRYPHWWKPPNNGLSPHVFWEAHLTTKALQATRCTAARADGFCLSAATIEISVLKQLHLGLCDG